jgi:poly-gamma-glutamate synthesis protein (capsule biosynthesis protein)
MKRIVLVIGFILALSAIVWFGWYRANHNIIESETATPQSNVEIDEPEPVAERIEARWLFAGEVFWGRKMEQVAQTQSNPYSYLFSQLNSLKPDNYDAWLAHLECPVTSTIVPFSVQVEQLIFNCPPEYLTEFASWFDAVSLANNHIDNIDGIRGLKETRANLEKVDVQYYGHFDSAVTEDICEVVSLPVRVIYNDSSEREELFPVALCGYNNVFRLPTKTELDVIEDYAGRFFTVVSPQQGAEYADTADSIKVETYSAMIDRGADMVIASHPHWVQNTEVYKGKLIMYSIGNFMFDQEWSEEVKRGAVLDLLLNIDYDETTQKWLELANSCLAFQDNCLEDANDSKLTKPTPQLVFGLVSVLHENALTRLAPDNIHQLNIQRTNWDQTRLKLNPHD